MAEPTENNIINLSEERVKRRPSEKPPESKKKGLSPDNFGDLTEFLSEEVKPDDDGYYTVRLNAGTELTQADIDDFYLHFNQTEESPEENK